MAQGTCEIGIEAGREGGEGVRGVRPRARAPLLQLPTSSYSSSWESTWVVPPTECSQDLTVQYAFRGLL